MRCVNLVACFLLVGPFLVTAQRIREGGGRNAGPIAARNPFETEADIAAGQRIFRTRCGFCHGQSGEGGRGATLNTGVFRYGNSDRELFRTIQNGIPNTEMPGSFQDEPDIWRVVGYVKRLGAQHVPEEKAPGDANAGRAVYASNGCSGCHVLNGDGNYVGPDLSEIGAARSLQYLRQSIVNPSADVPLDFRTVRVSTLTGAMIAGIVLNEDDYSIQLRDMSGNSRSLLKSDLKEIQHSRDSLMPAYGSLSAADLDNLLAFLHSLREKR